MLCKARKQRRLHGLTGLKDPGLSLARVRRGDSRGIQSQGFKEDGDLSEVQRSELDRWEVMDRERASIQSG